MFSGMALIPKTLASVLVRQPVVYPEDMAKILDTPIFQ
jgi:hypothetical protein